MNTMLALLVCLQTVDADAIRRDLRRFLKEGDAAAKEAVLKRGPSAVRVLYEERARSEGSFDAISELMFTLRFKEERSERAAAFRDFIASRDCPLRGSSESSLGYFLWQSVRPEPPPRKGLGGASFTLEEGVASLGCFVDPVVCPTPDEVPLQWPADYRWAKAYLELDRALAHFNLDWTCRYGVMVVSTPARLWPPVAGGRKLGAEETRKLQKAVADLDAADVETRERAAREVQAFGAEAIPLLKSVEGSAELKGRAAQVLKALESLYGGFVWGTRCGMDDQKLEGAELALAKSVNDAGPVNHGLRLEEVRLDAVVGILSRTSKVPIECDEVIADLKVSLPGVPIPLRDALLLVSKGHGLDVVVREGKVRVVRTK